MSNYTKSTLLISDLKMNTKPYSQIKHIWPPVGRHILARYDDSSVVVYQAFCPEIAKFACENGRFGGPKYSFERMTWIKTNFLWMMYRAGWATKKNQEHILAVTIKRHGFNEILRAANEAKGGDGKDVTTGIYFRCSNCNLSLSLSRQCWSIMEQQQVSNLGTLT